MKSIKITIMHVGRYKLEVFDDYYAGKDLGAGMVSPTGLVNSIDCGLAGLMVHLSKLIFQDEALAYEMDRRKSSDDLANEALEKMARDPAYQSPKAQKLIQSRKK